MSYGRDQLLATANLRFLRDLGNAASLAFVFEKAILDE
jgi:hypothetical protein